MMSLRDPLALRVARRFMAAALLRDVPTSGVEAVYFDGGLVTDVDLARLLEARVGVLLQVRFRRSLTGLPNTVSWEAVREDDEIVSGKLLLRAGVRENEVVSWAEITIDGDDPPSRTAFAEGSPTEQFLRARLRRVEQLARDLIDDARVQPQTPAFSLVEVLVRIVEEAEGS